MSHEKRSLVLITVDCLRADHCGFYGYARPTTPFLDALAAESYVVPTAIVGGAPTYYSFPTILASRMPLALGRDVIGLAPGETTLATVLRESGYATGAFSAANPYISPRFGYDQGFDTFRDFLEFEAQVAPNNENSDSVNSLAGAKSAFRGRLNRTARSVAGGFGLSRLYNELYFQYCMKNAPAAGSIAALQKFPTADVMVEEAQNWLSSVGQRPFFLWLHLMDPHSPYYPPDEAFDEFTGRKIDVARARYVNEYWNRRDPTAAGLRGKRDEVVQLYDAGIRWVDHQIARLVEGLKQTQRWGQAVLVLTGDHGEEFLEHGGRYHAPFRLSEEIIRVPLLIRIPSERAGKVPTSPMSHLHLAPTLLEILEVQQPTAFQGRSLWEHLRRGRAWDDPAIVECAFGCTNPFSTESRSAARLLAVREERYKLIMRMEPGVVEEIYDLETNRAEIADGSNGVPPDIRKRLLLTASEHMKKAVAARDNKMRMTARLRELRWEILKSDVPARMKAEG